MENKNFEGTFCKIIDKSGANKNPIDIETCCRAGKLGNTIVKFAICKDCQHTLKVKKDLSKLIFVDINLARDTKIFVN